MEQLSPELVLVSPDLRERARAALPERDPYAFLEFRRAPSPHPDLARFAFAADAVAYETQAARMPLPVRAAAYALVSLVQLLVAWAAVVALCATGAVVADWAF